MRHFLRDDDLSAVEQAEVLDLAARLKEAPYDEKPLAGPRTVAIIFDKPTLRTQASFVAGVAELGGHPMVVDGNLAQIGTRESVADTLAMPGVPTAMKPTAATPKAAVRQMTMKITNPRIDMASARLRIRSRETIVSDVRGRSRSTERVEK